MIVRVPLPLTGSLEPVALLCIGSLADITNIATNSPLWRHSAQYWWLRNITACEKLVIPRDIRIVKKC